MKKKKFPDMSGDGKVTKKDILMARGVIKKKDFHKAVLDYQSDPSDQTNQYEYVKYVEKLAIKLVSSGVAIFISCLC